MTRIINVCIPQMWSQKKNLLINAQDKKINSQRWETKLCLSDKEVKKCKCEKMVKKIIKDGKWGEKMASVDTQNEKRDAH